MTASPDDSAGRFADEVHLARVALALGAAQFGGPLSARELRVQAAAARIALPISGASLGQLRSDIRDGADPLGAAFCALRGPRERRQRGAFYTAPEIVEPMVRWVLERGAQVVIDPGCGSGRFALRALALDRRVRAVAVDVDPIATLLTRASLAVRQETRAIVLNGDYTTVRLPDCDGRRAAFIGNPPYVRHHALSSQTKARARRMAKALGYAVSGLAGLHALFFLATAAKARTGDVGCYRDRQPYRPRR